MSASRFMDNLETAIRSVLPSDWILERSLTFSAITPDLLLVHPEKGVVVVAVSTPSPGFCFADYDRDRDVRERWDSMPAEQQALHGDVALTAGWDGLADPRELLVDWHGELSDYFSSMLERRRNRYLRAVLLVVQNSEPEEGDVVFRPVGKKAKDGVFLEWIQGNPRDISSLQLADVVPRLVPQAFADEDPMPDTIWQELKSKVLGIGDDVMGMRPPPDFRFDPKQRKVLEYIATPGLKRFKGPAGSGKTLVIARRVADSVLAGQKVLVVVYNKTLCQMISTKAKYFVNEGVTDLDQRHKNNRKFNELVFIAWQDKWWNRVCAHTGRSKQRKIIYAANAASEDEARRVIEKKMPRLVQEGLESARGGRAPGLFYDVVITDEAQNMMPESWPCIRAAASGDDSTVVVVSDPTQSMYGQRAWTDQSMTGFKGNPWRRLDDSYRLPEDYLAFLSAFVSEFPPDEEVIVPQPSDKLTLSKTSLYRIGTKDQFARDKAAAAVDFAMNVLNFLPHQIVILAATNSRGSAIVNRLKELDIKVSHTFDPSMRPNFGTSEYIRASTYHSYVGWESPCVILDHDFSPKQENTNGLFYSGLTRLSKRDIGSAVIVLEAESQYTEIVHRFCEEIAQ